MFDKLFKLMLFYEIMLYFLNLVVENLWNDINFYLSYMGIDFLLMVLWCMM